MVRPTTFSILIPVDVINITDVFINQHPGVINPLNFYKGAKKTLLTLNLLTKN